MKSYKTFATASGGEVSVERTARLLCSGDCPRDASLRGLCRIVDGIADSYPRDRASLGALWQPDG